MRSRLTDSLLFTAGVFVGASATLGYAILTAPVVPTSIVQIERAPDPTLESHPFIDRTRPEISL